MSYILIYIMSNSKQVLVICKGFSFKWQMSYRLRQFATCHYNYKVALVSETRRTVSFTRNVRNSFVFVVIINLFQFILLKWRLFPYRRSDGVFPRHDLAREPNYRVGHCGGRVVELLPGFLLENISKHKNMCLFL